MIILVILQQIKITFLVSAYSYKVKVKTTNIFRSDQASLEFSVGYVNQSKLLEI